MAAGLAGCGEDARERQSEWADAPPAPSNVIACGKGATAASTLELPGSLPIPRGARVTAVRRRGDLVRVDLRLPLSLDASVNFVLKRFEPAGWKFEEGEQEGTAAEMEFEGHEHRGRLRVYHDPCRGRTHADLVLAPE